MHRGRVAGRPALGAEPWRRVEATRTFSDLALPDSVLDVLRTVPGRFSERFWTSAPRLPGGPADGRRGVLLLFTGQSNADKAAAAEALATEVRLPLLHADLAEVFGRDRAQAAQLQARLFAAAQRLGAVLVLDGADTVFHSVTGAAAPMSTVDRTELLRRSEAHPGLVIFPLPADAVLEAAERERFDAVVDFALPDPAERTNLWRRAMPAGAAITETDIAMLAGAFALPASAIAACCTVAAATARAEGGPVRRDHLAEALAGVYAERADGDHVRPALAELRQPSRVNGATPTAPPPAFGALPVAAVRSETGGWYQPEPAGRTAPADEPEPAAPDLASAPTSELAAELAPVADHAAPAAVAEPVRTPDPEPAAVAAPEEPTPEPSPDAAAQLPPPALEPAPAAPRRAARPAIGPAWLRRPLPLALLGGLVAAVLGLNLSERKPPTAPRPAPPAISFSATAAIGGARVNYPSNWSRATPAPAEPGLPLRHELALRSSGSDAGELVLGMASPAVASPLPGRFIAATLPGTPQPQLVALGAHRFERTLDPRLALGGDAHSVYGLATATGTFVGVCHTRSTAFAAQCERVLGTLSGVGAPRATPPVTHPYRSALTRILGSLEQARGADSRALATARSGNAQARAARALAGALASAATEISRLAAGRAASANGTLVAVLRQVSGNYRALAIAALRVDLAGYAAAARTLGAGEIALTDALTRVRASTR